MLQSPSALKLWQQDGISLESIKYFQLGYCKSKAIYCGYHERIENKETLTIPIFEDGQLINIRHRILNPCNPHDKYRPEKPDRGLSLFNSGILNTSANTDDILLVAGEKKVIVLQQYIDFNILPIISSTGGCSSWYGQYAALWSSLLATRVRIYIGFDPGEEKAAQRTAMLFGRRSYLVEFPMKPDDLCLLPNGTSLVLDTIGEAEALRSKSVWL